MRIRTRYEKVQGDPVKVGVWVITQLKDPREVRLYKSAGSSMKDGYVQVSGPAPVGLQVHDWGISLRRDPRNKLKVGSDGDRIEWFGNSWRLRIDAEPRDAKAEYPEQGSSVQVYTNDDPDKYVELETQGPLLTMKKGDKQERVNTYTLTKTDLYNPESLANSTPSKKRSGNLALTKEFCMEARIDVSKVSPAAYRAMYALEQYVHSSKLEPALVLLLKVRASQINGCAYCIDMHWKDARAGGETEQRLYGLDAWREAPYYSERERAAFTWIESLTNITEGHVPDSVFEEAKKVFSEQELVDLAMVGVAINGWNRLAIGFRAPAGTYVPKQHELKKSA
jgi:AhpD family alkylhydroperoxidase